ncbi:MAG TPA: glycosyltransferase family 4 protein [Acidisarcina sp.]
MANPLPDSAVLKKVGTPPPLRPFWKLGEADNVIGVIEPCYSATHVVYGMDSEKYVHQTLHVAPLKKLDMRKGTFFHFTPLIIDASVPLVHTLNRIPVNKDFIVSFELELPRYLLRTTPARIRFAMKLLRSSRCKKILPWSEFAYKNAAKRLTDFGFADVIPKMEIFRGGFRDPLLRPGLPPRPRAAAFGAEPLTAVIIGTHLFRKGGMYSIQAFEKMQAMGMNVRLTIIGDFEKHSYAFGALTPDLDRWRARAKSHDWIDFMGPIPNNEVFNQLRRHHVCLYPSLDESLGWLQVEAMMIGTPVVANRVCAFPEIVDHMRTGWLTDLPLQESGRWEGIGAPAEFHKEAIARADDLATQGIVDCMTLLYNNPALLEEWSRAGRERSCAMYGMEVASKHLEDIYDRVLGRALNELPVPRQTTPSF